MKAQLSHEMKPTENVNKVKGVEDSVDGAPAARSADCFGPIHESEGRSSRSQMGVRTKRASTV